MSQVDESLRNLVGESLRELLAAYAISGEAIPQTEGEPETAAFVGFAGDEIKGGVLLIATHRALSQTRPQIGGDAPAGERELNDWLAELCNQLLGRLKNKLLPRGVTVYISVPSIVSGRDLVPAVSTHDDGRPQISFHEVDGPFRCSVNAEHQPDFSIPEISEDYVAQSVEGDIMLF